MRNQKTTDKFWIDESGTQVPFSYVSKSARFQERESFKIFKEAAKINAELIAFKTYLNEVCKRVYIAFMQEKENDKKGKGNFTWFNFDRSIKVEVSISDRIEFDDLGIIACKDKLNEFLDSNIESKDDAVKSMILDAFNNTKGELDAKKVMNLLRYKSKIKNQLFQDAMVLLEGSIRNPDSTTYYRVWMKDEFGKFINIDLNMSSIC